MPCLVLAFNRKNLVEIVADFSLMGVAVARCGLNTVGNKFLAVERVLKVDFLIACISCSGL